MYTKDFFLHNLLNSTYMNNCEKQKFLGRLGYSNLRCSLVIAELHLETCPKLILGCS